MPVTIDEAFEFMESCNGEIRVMKSRYGGGWLACGCAIIEWDFDEMWSDLVGGDLCYFDAVKFFNSIPGLTLIENAKTPIEAFNLCIEQIAKKID